jgi:hypothetical protein
MRATSLLIAAASLAAAVFAGADAWVRAHERTAPQMSAHVPVPNGFALAKRAERIVAAAFRVPETPNAEPVLTLTKGQRETAIELSMTGYVQEPLNPTALRTLAFIADADDNRPRARRLMTVASHLTRRDLATNAWLGQDYARLGDEDNALLASDQALRSSERAQELILPVLLDYLRNDEVVPPVVELLSQEPLWQDAFWASAPRFSASLGNLARVREAVARDGIKVRPEYDRTLVSELANHGHLASAERLVHLLAADDRADDEVIRNGEFDTVTAFEPFGWELFFDSSLSTDLSQSQGVLRVSTFADGGGRAARQAVSLPRDVYTLIVKADEWDQLDERALYVRLDCAEVRNPPATTPIAIDRPSLSVTFRKPQANCTYYWLTIFARSREDRRDNVVTLDRISLRPADDEI